MADRARSAFMILKSKRQRIEDDKDDFHVVNKRFKREGDPYLRNQIFFSMWISNAIPKLRKKVLILIPGFPESDSKSDSKCDSKKTPRQNERRTEATI